MLGWMLDGSWIDFWWILGPSWEASWHQVATKIQNTPQQLALWRILSVNTYIDIKIFACFLLFDSLFIT